MSALARIRIVWLVCALVILAIGGWWARRAFAGREVLPSTVVQLGDLSEYVTCRGTLSARRAAVLVAPNRVQNLRITYLAPGGNDVKKGEVVVRLDVSGLEQQAEQLALALKTAQATLDQAQSQTAITHQQDLLTLVDDQVAQGHAQIKAQQDSVKSRITGAESDLSLATAKAVVAAAEATNHLHATAAAAQLQSLRATRDKAAAQLRREQAAIADATLRAPIAGVITYNMNYSNFNDPHPYRVGDVVSAGDEIGQIPDLQTLEVDADLQQTDRGAVRVGDAVTADAAALPEVRLAGAVQSIADLTSFDFGGTFPPPRIFRLIASLHHPDARLRPQMNVTAKIIIRQLHHVPLVPVQAVFTRNGRPIVYILVGNRYQPHPVTELGQNPTEAAVSGVAPGARVALREPGVKPARAPASASGAGLGSAKP